MKSQLLLLFLFLSSCSHPLSEYTSHNSTPRQNLPSDYIAYLKQTRYTHQELDHLPPYAILFHGNPTPFFPSLNLSPNNITTLDLGTTDTSTLYLIHPPTGTPFLINRAQPGAGGTATQTAELAALGIHYIVHIGTSGLLGPSSNESTVTLSTSSYKDGAATLLSSAPKDPLSHPDLPFTHLLQKHLPSSRLATGYTIPIYYFQPEGLITSLLTDKQFSSPRPTYLEMEESPFFESALLTHTHAASLTVPSDRYTLDSHHHLTHTFLNDKTTTQSLTTALRATLATFNDLSQPPK